ncbi:AAA family ATPase [uncultured Thiodictyon sp.]|uniref:AAA family ATPase n=1 Tax=uncultured Thiodictyon sp. TaxID=1846217 RepID=UPI0025CF29B4|nr:AAA family ATPase [uncultured Thiodictyon sp.]
MSDEPQEAVRNMTSAFAALTRIAKPGKTLCLRLAFSMESPETCGVLLELLPDGLIFDTSSGTEWIPATDIVAWRVPRQSPSPATTSQQTSPDFSGESPEESIRYDPESAERISTAPAENLLSLATKSLPTPADLELLFAGDPFLPLSAPSFNIPSLSKDIQQEINRWKNRYDYAQKVHEPARMSQDAARIAELAETLEEPYLNYLAGLLADYSGLGISRARTYFQKTLELEQNHQAATVALATLAIRENDWQNAIKFLLWATHLDGESDKINLVRCLGQCVLRLNEAIHSPIGALLSLDLSDTGRRLVSSIVALAVREDADGYSAALSGDIEKLRQTKIGNDLFPWKDRISAPVEPRITKPTKVSARDAIRRGWVSAYYPGRSFGFLVEDSTGQTWFFHRNEVISPSLLHSLTKGNVRQDITFSGKTDALSGKYPLANQISVLAEDTHLPSEATKRAPLKLRLQAIPKDGSWFAKAMAAEQLDQLDEAESYYRKEISGRGTHFKSAIKQLAALRSRKGRPDDAIELLDKHRYKFLESEVPSLDQMLVQLLVKTKNYSKAGQLLSGLAKQATDKSKRIAYLRQEAYCMLAAGQFDSSIRILKLILTSNPYDNATVLLLEKANDAKETGIIPIGDSAGESEDEYNDFISSSLGISLLARRQLEHCELRGIDTRTKESGSYQTQDVRQVQVLLDRLKGRRPRERADYLLTLAWLCEHASNVTESRSIHEYLRRHFLAVAEAAMSEDFQRDSVRCYALESLILCPIRLEPGREAQTSFEAAWVLLLGTYLSNMVEPSALLQPDTGKRLPNVLNLLTECPDDWSRFVNDAPFYQIRAPSAYEHFTSVCEARSDLKLTPQCQSKERLRLRELENALKCLSGDALSADGLRRGKEAVAEQMVLVRFELDRKRLTDLVKLFGDASDYALERHFRERETKFLRLGADIARHIEELQRHPTHLSIERLLPILVSLLELLKADFSRAETAKPSLELRNVLDSDFYVVNDGTVALRLQLISKDESSPPIEAIGLVLEKGHGDPCHSPDPLHGGQTREIELAIRPLEHQIEDGTFSVQIAVEYRNRKGATEKSQPFSLAVRLGEQGFEEIPNPYGRYSGGSPVEDEDMFFGRAALIDRVSRYLSSGSLGQCFVLYGQKRSGKSSVLKQVERRLGKSVFFAPMSAGTFTPGNLWGSFARLFVQEVTFCLEDANVGIPENWPSRSEVDAGPLEAIRDVARGLTKRGHQVAVAIDEFTYIFENAHRDVEAFMRGWKALLEARTFNALLVGQDTMPRFKQTFPNEFGVTHDERISYLNEEEAAALASKPILLNGSSRYRGQALHRLFDLTAGSPFFLQIACDRLVRHLNSRNAAFVTEADIDQIARTLTVGNEALPPERFDALVTAAGEKVATVPRDDLWRVLARIARESLHSEWCYKDALSELLRSGEALKDLIDREILAVEGERVSIRVGLFASWLRANQ